MMAGRQTIWWAAAAVVLALAAGLWWQTGRIPDAGLAAIGDDPDTAFAVMRCDARSRDEGPALAVTFSRPLAGRQSLDDLLKVVDLGEADATADAARAGRRLLASGRQPANCVLFRRTAETALSH
jgi:hypothetical protein